MRPWLLPLLAVLDRRVLWRVPTGRREVFLTFDDGPVAGVTPWVLDTLAGYKAKATFFCLGSNAAGSPELMERLRAEGHAVGHHTWDHPDGWRTRNRAYYRNVLRGRDVINSRLFRPPYGRLGPLQLNRLRKRFRPVLWDVLSGDFKPRMPGEACARGVLERAVPGSIIVFHDNRQSARCLKEALPLVLEGFARRGYRFSALPGDQDPTMPVTMYSTR
jgi:peptidoglycan/xylan/chitin deacetylase (PgdA/CDA1 family)